MSDQLPNSQDYESELKKAVALRKQTGDLLKTLMADLMILMNRLNQLKLDLKSDNKNKNLMLTLTPHLDELLQILQMLTGLQGAIEHSKQEDEESIFETKLSMTQNPIVITGMNMQIVQITANLKQGLEETCKNDNKLSVWTQAYGLFVKAEQLGNGLSELVKNIYAERALLDKLNKLKEALKGEHLSKLKSSAHANKRKSPEELCHLNTEILFVEPVILVGGENDSFGFSCERKLVEGSSYVTMVPNIELKKVIDRFKENGFEFYASDKDLFKWELPFIDVKTGETFEKSGNSRYGVPNENLVRAIDRFRKTFGYN